MKFKKAYFILILFGLMFLMVACDTDEPPLTGAQLAAHEFIIAVEAYDDSNVDLFEITALKSHYNSLTDEAKALVTEAHAALIGFDHAYFEYMMNQIGAIDLNDKVAIDAAATYYNDSLWGKDQASDLKDQLDGLYDGWDALIDSYIAPIRTIVEAVPANAVTGEALQHQITKIAEAVQLSAALPNVVLPHALTLIQSVTTKKNQIDGWTTSELNAFKELFNSHPDFGTYLGEELDEKHEQLENLYTAYTMLSLTNKNKINSGQAGITFDYINLQNGIIKPGYDIEVQIALEALQDLEVKYPNHATDVVEAFYSSIEAVDVLADLSTLVRSDETIADLVNWEQDHMDLFLSEFETQLADLIDLLDSISLLPLPEVIDDYDAKLYAFVLIYQDQIDFQNEVNDDLFDLGRDILESFALEEASDLLDYAALQNETISEYDGDLLADITEHIDIFNDTLSSYTLNHPTTKAAMDKLMNIRSQLTNFVDHIILDYTLTYQSLDVTTSTWTATVQLSAVVYAPTGSILTTVPVTSNIGNLTLQGQKWVITDEIEITPAPGTTPGALNSMLLTPSDYLIATSADLEYTVAAGAKEAMVHVTDKTPVDSIGDVTYIDRLFTATANHTDLDLLVEVVYNDDIVSSFTTPELYFGDGKIYRDMVDFGLPAGVNYTVDIYVYRVPVLNAFAKSIAYVIEDHLVTPLVPDANSNYFRATGNGEFANVQTNRGTINLSNPSVDFARIYIYDTNEGTPTGENALGYFDIKYYPNTLEVGSNAALRAHFGTNGSIAFGGDLINDAWTTAPNTKTILQGALGELYDAETKYYFAGQLFVTENSVYTDHSPISTYHALYWRESVPIEGGGAPTITSGYARPEGQGYVPLQFDRITTGVNVTLTHTAIDHLVVRIYTEQNEAALVGSFRVLNNRQVWSGDGLTNFNINVIGDPGNMYVVAATAKDILVKALGDAYEPTTPYYFTSQLIVTEDGLFDEDSEISSFTTTFWREMLATSDKPETSVDLFRTNGDDTAIEVDRFPDLRLSNTYVDYFLVRVYLTNTGDKSTSQAFEIRVEKTETGARVYHEASGASATLQGANNNFYFWPTTPWNTFISEIFTYENLTWNVGTEIFFTTQVMIKEGGPWTSNSEISGYGAGYTLPTRPSSS